MTPKEKGKELVLTYYNLKKRPLISFWRDMRSAKQSALIAVDEIINIYKVWENSSLQWDYPNFFKDDFWQQVKDEIEKL